MAIAFGSTDKGLIRESNQDCFECAVLSDTLAFAVLCDGIGGENGGDIASKIACSFASSILKRDLCENMTELSLRSVLYSAFSGANAMVYEKSKEDSALAGMGTTMIVAVLSGEAVYISHVGDSRVYMVNGDDEKLLTHDHTLVQMLVDEGKLSEEEAQTHPKKHYLTRAVGVTPIVDVEFNVYRVAGNSVIVLCSDGLYRYLTPGILPALIKETLQSKNAENLISFANKSGGSDNITAAIIV